MPYSIELFLDSPGDARVRALWDQVAAFGSPSMRESGARPHVSLAVCEAVDVAAARQLLERFAEGMAPLAISLASLGMFPGAAPVVFLAPKVTSGLLRLHDRFFAEFAMLAKDCWPHYAPAQWVPHCTLAHGLGPEELAPVLDLCRGISLPINCAVAAIGLVRFRPVEELYAVTLAGEVEG